MNSFTARQFLEVSYHLDGNPPASVARTRQSFGTMARRFFLRGFW